MTWQPPGFDGVWTRARIGDEMGLSEGDLAALYGVDLDELDGYLADLEDDPSRVWERIIADLDALRFGYRHLEIADAHIEGLRGVLIGMQLRSPVLSSMATGHLGWHIHPDDAQDIAAQAAIIIGLDQADTAVLARRLARAITWPTLALPDNPAVLVDRLVDLSTYLAELSGLL